MVALNFVEWSIDKQSNGDLFQSLIVPIVMQTINILSPILSTLDGEEFPLLFRGIM